VSIGDPGDLESSNEQVQRLSIAVSSIIGHGDPAQLVTHFARVVVVDHHARSRSTVLDFTSDARHVKRSGPTRRRSAA